MGKRLTKKETEGVIYLALIGGFVWLIIQFTEMLGGIENIAIIGAVIIAVVVLVKVLNWISNKKALAEKRRMLMKKYNDEDIVKNIMNKVVWQGQDSKQVIESLGSPEDVDQKVLKTKKKEIWKYGYEGGNRYLLRITLENDVVVGWEQRT